MYVTASFLVKNSWGRPRELANGLGVLLLTWNQALYRYGVFDFKKLEGCLKRNAAKLESLRERHILDAAQADDSTIRELFTEFLAALAIAERSKRGTRSPVATAKALHLLAPHFFPLWDRKIADAYDCSYSRDPASAYLRFFGKMQILTRTLPKRLRAGVDGKTVLKLIDEYNYATFTQNWAKSDTN